ncbi:Uncharacterised protein [Bordetella pertussis]|nr:Uncharacterised protein [Bordetella pertussis]
MTPCAAMARQSSRQARASSAARSAAVRTRLFCMNFPALASNPRRSFCHAFSPQASNP